MSKTADKYAAARARFEEHGVSIASWAREQKVSSSLVYEILAGRKSCKRGSSHRIAVLLGLKAGSLEPLQLPPVKPSRKET